MKIFLSILLIAVTLKATNLEKGMEALEVGNFKKAVEYFKLSAAEGNVMAMHNLSVMYNNGYGVEKDTKVAASWLNSATLSN